MVPLSYTSRISQNNRISCNRQVFPGFSVVLIQLRSHFCQNVAPFDIQSNPGSSNLETRTPLLTRTKFLFPLDLNPLFSHFYSINSNSDNSNSPLTRTIFRLRWSKITPITRILVLTTHHGCPLKYPISYSCRVIGKNTKLTLQQFDFN